jgi:predicted TIM-barrel fold metal-dependent hydrolase
MDTKFGMAADFRFSRHARREFLAGLGALATSSFFSGSALAQKMPDAAGSSSNWVDVHHHFSPPAYAEVTNQKKVMPAPLVGWTPQKTIEDMDAAGVRTAMNSIVGPGVWFDDAAQARHLARDANEYAAKLVANYPGRFGSFATVTLPDIDGSLREVEYALDTLKADGIMLFTSYNDKWLGDPYFDPLFEELNRRKAVVFTHPTTNACCANLLPGISSAEIEYGTDTTRAIVRMVYSGAAKRYPDVRMIFSHGGGTMPYLIGRFMNRVSRSKGNGGQQEHDFQAEVSKFYYDTAQTFNPVPMTALKHVVPVSQILFGTDYPYRSSVENTRGLKDGGAFDSRELDAVKSKNAFTLLPQLQKLGDVHAAISAVAATGTKNSL